MRPLAAIAVTLAVAACATPQREPPPRPFTGTRWIVALELPPAGEPPSFRFGDGRVEGFAGCNQVVARYVQDTVGARAIVIGRLEVGRRDCDAGARATEAHVLNVLQAVSSYTVVGDVLTMTGSAGTLRFRAAPEERK